jgi:hypothetical protein
VAVDAEHGDLDDCVVEHALPERLHDQCFPSNWIHFPRPWLILLDLELLKEWNLSTVDHPVCEVELNNHARAEVANVEDVKLSLGQYEVTWENLALVCFRVCPLKSESLNNVVLNIRDDALVDHCHEPHADSWQIVEDS